MSSKTRGSKKSGSPRRSRSSSEKSRSSSSPKHLTAFFAGPQVLHRHRSCSPERRGQLLTERIKQFTPKITGKRRTSSSPMVMTTAEIARYYAIQSRRVPHVLKYYLAPHRISGLSSKECIEHMNSLLKQTKGHTCPYALSVKHAYPYLRYGLQSDKVWRSEAEFHRPCKQNERTWLPTPKTPFWQVSLPRFKLPKDALTVDHLWCARSEASEATDGYYEDLSEVKAQYARRHYKRLMVDRIAPKSVQDRFKRMIDVYTPHCEIHAFTRVLWTPSPKDLHPSKGIDMHDNVIPSPKRLTGVF